MIFHEATFSAKTGYGAERLVCEMALSAVRFPTGWSEFNVIHVTISLFSRPLFLSFWQVSWTWSWVVQAITLLKNLLLPVSVFTNFHKQGWHLEDVCDDFQQRFKGRGEARVVAMPCYPYLMQFLLHLLLALYIYIFILHMIYLNFFQWISLCFITPMVENDSVPCSVRVFLFPFMYHLSFGWQTSSS